MWYKVSIISTKLVTSSLETCRCGNLCGFTCRFILIKAMTMMAVTVVIVSTILYYYSASTSLYHNTTAIFLSERLNNQVNPSLRRSYDSADFGYVVTLRYTGQQGTGIQALMSLQCFIGSLNLSMYILEPSMTRTSFGSSISQIHNSSSLKFSDMFDVTHF